MAKIKVKFNNKDYQIEETAFNEGKAKVSTHLSGEMKGTGATVKFGGTAYDVDSTKLSSSAAALAAHLGAIVGSGVKIIIGGVEYGVDSEKVAGAMTEVETTLAGMSGSEDPDVPVEPDVPEVDENQGLEYTSNGDGTCYVSGIGTCTDTDVIIPSVSPDGDSVTGIGDSAFDLCTSLTSITIPNSVTSIGDNAFYWCYELKRIDYSGTKAQWGTIEKGYDWIDKSRGTTIYCADGELYVFIYNDEYIEYTSNSDGTCYVSAIGDGNVTDLVIPSISPEGETVTGIGYNAFEGCGLLESITIPDSVTSIGDYAFEGCGLLESINFTGTMEQWMTIEKSETWCSADFANNGVIFCIDGDILLGEPELPI